VFFTALGYLPPAGSLPRVRLLHEPAVNNPLDVTPSDDCMTIRAGLPPVPSKLVSRIEAGNTLTWQNCSQTGLEWLDHQEVKNQQRS